ncbi:MAG: plasmid pRiA4b ORF-3 family protein [Anaerolineales bacterium]|nr:plasmid pRiA4b ORF-3 family protein [Anaerolineales bacterium]
MPKPIPIYQIKITLDGIRPPIWRRIQVPGNFTLSKLHDVIQIIMGWYDCHLHHFIISDRYYGNPEYDEYGDLETIPEGEFKLNKVIPGEGFRFKYVYDFGDDWEHTMVVEKITYSDKRENHPMCISGKRACPPEDVGGRWGYQEFIDALNDPEHDEHDEYLVWVGGEYDPGKFDQEEVNTRLWKLSLSPSAKIWEVEDERKRHIPDDHAQFAADWARNLPANVKIEANNLPICRDVGVLLVYIRDHRLTGAKTTGNLPLKAVREIAGMMVDPPVLDIKYGFYKSPLRSEEEVWPLYFRHILAATGGLVMGGPGRRWYITPLGIEFLDAPAPLQIFILFTAYWTQIEWDFFTDITFESSRVQEAIQDASHKLLLELPLNEFIPFEVFADRVVEQSRLSKPSQDEDTATRIMRTFIKNILINPLHELGVLDCDYRTDEEKWEGYKELVGIKLTPLGRELLMMESK